MKNIQRLPLQIVLSCILISLSTMQYVKAQSNLITELSPIADTWVRSTGTDKDLNYGSDSTLMTRHSSSAYNEIAFLKFDLTNILISSNSVIDSAKLLMTMVYNQSSGGVVNILPMNDDNDSWDEHAITWNTGRPDTVHGALPIGTATVAKINPEVASIDGTIYDWDLTGQVKSELSDSNKILSVALFPNYKTDVNIRFLSKESAVSSRRPKLIIYSHATNPNSFDINAISDPYNNQILLSWKTTNENNIAYFRLLHSTDESEFTPIANVENQGLSNDTVSYRYQHFNPAQNKTHFYKIETVLNDSSRHMSMFISANYGLTSMVHRNEWVFNEIPSMDLTRSRLVQSLQMADYNPVGLRSEPNVPLMVHVEQISGAALPKLIVGTYDRQSVHTYDLSIGENTITDANGGDLYIKYSSDNPNPQNKVRITFHSGYQQMPLYILGNTTHQEWLNQLTADLSSPNVTLIANRVFIVVSKQSAIDYKNANQDTLLTYMDDIMRAEDKISGLDNSSLFDKPAYDNKLMLLEKASGNPDATSYGRVRIPTGSIRWILDPSYISDGEGGWGIYHEIGHHHQQYPWSWSACTEVTVNIYSMAAKRYFHPGSMGMASEDWDKTMQYLEDTSTEKNYNSSANYVKLGLWNQLGMAFGDSFYHKLHKRTRAEKIIPSGDAAEIRLLMLYSCKISGKNLTKFFKQWNLPVDPTVYTEIANLGLPTPATNPAQLREDWAVSITRIGDTTSVDSVILEGSAYGPAGIEKVEFYGDGVKIGEATQRPFRFVWKNIAAGSHTAAMKAYAEDNSIITSAPLTITQKAVSITYPQDNSAFTSGSSIDLQAITAPGNAISKVAFYANGLKVGEAQTAPYHINWSAPANGIYDLIAKVTYQGGGEDFSSHIGVAIGSYLPVADAYIRDGGNANVNYGLDSTLVVKKDVGSYNRISYLKFPLEPLYANTDSLKLDLQINSSNSNVSKTQWQLWLVKNNNWEEEGITWNNQPAADSLLGTIDTKKTGAIEWTIPANVSDLLASDGTLSLAVISTTVNATSDASFYSRNAASIALRPRLIIFPHSLQTDMLPVTYSSLKAKYSGYQVVLQWQTFTEHNVNEFEIEHSIDGKSFMLLGKESALGNNTTGHNYQFIHSNPVNGMNYYRFKELDKTGEVQYSNVAIVNIHPKMAIKDIKLFPNPIKRGEALSIMLPKGFNKTISARIINLNGKQIYSKQFVQQGAPRIKLDTKGMQPGIYFLQLMDITKDQINNESSNYKSGKFIIQ